MLLSGEAFAQSEVRIAAASDLSAALKEIATDFQKQAGTQVRMSFGSSGNFYAQIQNGAPFDLFFSADADYPRRLESAGLADPGTFYKYAQGRIVIWVPENSTINISKLGMKALLDPTVRKISIANPDHAPYGRAAKAAMEHFGIADKVRDKLVFGENISQATQFIETGNAQIGIIALSLALSPALKDKGRYWEIPLDTYPALDQAAIVIKSSKIKLEANAFLSYVRSSAGTDVLRRFGFIVPGAQRTPQSQGAKKP